MSTVVNADLRAATERLRRIRSGEDFHTVYGGNQKPILSGGKEVSAFADPVSVDKCLKDQQRVVGAYLAEHPADDDEPITEEWIATTSLYKCLSGTNYHLGCGEGSGMCLFWYLVEDFGKGPGWYLEECPLPIQPKTRGDLRRLCAVINIDLRKREVSK